MKMMGMLDAVEEPLLQLEAVEPREAHIDTRQLGTISRGLARKSSPTEQFRPQNLAPDQQFQKSRTETSSSTT